VSIGNGRPAKRGLDVAAPCPAALLCPTIARSPASTFWSKPMSDVSEAKRLYEDARKRAAMPPLPEKRLLEIARAKVAFAKMMMKNGPEPRQFGFHRAATTPWLAMPTPIKAEPAAPLSIIDSMEARLWSPGCTAFWLHPERWADVPYGANGHLEPFWMHLP
jgi:hypothetical protein